MEEFLSDHELAEVSADRFRRLHRNFVHPAIDHVSFCQDKILGHSGDDSVYSVVSAEFYRWEQYENDR